MKSRRRFRYCITAGTLLALCAVRCYAETVSWEDVRREVVRNNPSVIMASRALRAKQISLSRTYTEFFPSLSFSASWRRSSSATSLESLAEGSVRDTEMSYGLSASLSLFEGFSDISSVRKAGSELEAEKARYRRSLSDATAKARIAFLELLGSQEEAVLAERILARRSENRDLVGMKYEAGREDKGAYLRSEADFYQAQYELQKARRTLKISKTGLLREMGKDGHEEITASGDLEITGLEVPDQSPGEIYGTIPEYVIAARDMESAEHSLVNARSSLYPTLSLSGSKSRSGSEFPLERDRWSMGISLSYPLFSSGRDMLDIKDAKNSLERYRQNLRKTRNDIIYLLEDTHASLRDSVDELEVREKYYEATMERSRISRAKYMNGLMSYESWDIIENEFINAEKSLLQARLRSLEVMAEWKRVLGEEQ